MKKHLIIILVLISSFAFSQENKDNIKGYNICESIFEIKNEKPISLYRCIKAKALMKITLYTLVQDTNKKISKTLEDAQKDSRPKVKFSFKDLSNLHKILEELKSNNFEKITTKGQRFSLQKIQDTNSIMIYSTSPNDSSVEILESNLSEFKKLLKEHIDSIKTKKGN